MPNREGDRQEKELLTREDVQALIAACSASSPTGIRNAAMIATMYFSFARVQETLDLFPKDVEHPKEAGKAPLLNIRSGKGAKQRRVPLHPDAMPYVLRWLDTRKALGINGVNPVFCQISRGSHGKPIDPSYVRHLLPRLAGKAGIERRVHCHGLRYSGATNAHRAGASITEVSLWLGHQNVATTASYLLPLAPDELARKAEALSF